MAVSCQRLPGGRADRWSVRNGHFAEQVSDRQAAEVPELTDREVLDAILTSCQYVHVKLDQILEFFGDDGEEEEDEADG
jgi:hypothetical protein